MNSDMRLSERFRQADMGGRVSELQPVDHEAINIGIKSAQIDMELRALTDGVQQRTNALVGSAERRPSLPNRLKKQDWQRNSTTSVISDIHPIGISGRK